QRLNRFVDLLVGGAPRTEQLDELTPATVQHLGSAVQDLAAVHRSAGRPSGHRATSGAHGIAQVLARAARDVDVAIESVGPSGFRAHELARDEQLVGLPYVDAAIGSVLGGRHHTSSR